jgi:hypothetical protein
MMAARGGHGLKLHKKVQMRYYGVVEVEPGFRLLAEACGQISG